ncbi:cytochrome c biogenesis protein ResB [Prochlorococcus marinus]|jgi:cytochrome c biogenesis protein|uniref:Cytochrome c biogenesis protein CcsB n=1 Tax=Prochlorococcus marinus (strain MIT 9301) TaxID=167546 RepID=CCS1_PROM0|nr:cytochrome c biogenesis protein ResB [Prochlorococcus marinus]A3PEU8.1 RecName: Full=Cytochrome c biogenesis protein CcsB [Prochlorococcus marinus str. MIT 9301]ABO18273.1 putative c-type cytochrome biogenesis protein Ccs1 [Prochlorococcus marinus str. MIT 9301]
MTIVKDLIFRISSLKFAISLIIFIAISSGVGTFIPQGSNSKFYIENFDEAPIFGFLNGEKVLILQLDHIYTSLWFLFALILLCISLAACSFRRQIPSLKASLKWIEYKSEKKFRKLQLNSSYQINEVEDLISKADLFLKKRGWKTYKFKSHISARKGLIGKIGPLVVHIGLIVLLIGSAYGSFTSQSKEQYLLPGESLDLINESTNSKANIKLVDFSIERESDGIPKQFISKLDFTSEDSKFNEVKTAKVNHPIRFKGLTIYQADWAISNIVLEIDNILYQLQLKEIPEIGNQVWGILIELGSETKKNFLLTIDNENGPLKISNTENFSGNNLYINENPLEVNSSKVSLKKIIPSSGLIIKNDPSIPFIYFSFILIIFGTIISLIPTNQLWILVNQESQSLSIGGLSNKNLVGFKKEFFKLSEEIKNF